MIWKNEPSIEVLNDISKNTMVSHLGIEIVEIGDDYLKATMPVDERTKQPLGLLHGGASVALSETMGSIASLLVCDDPTSHAVVGIQINANHLKSVRTGKVTSITKPVRIGKKIQVWDTSLYSDEDDLICTSRLTTMRIPNKQ